MMLLLIIFFLNRLFHYNISPASILISNWISQLYFLWFYLVFNFSPVLLSLFLFFLYSLDLLVKLLLTSVRLFYHTNLTHSLILSQCFHQLSLEFFFNKFLSGLILLLFFPYSINLSSFGLFFLFFSLLELIYLLLHLS